MPLANSEERHISDLIAEADGEIIASETVALAERITRQIEVASRASDIDQLLDPEAQYDLIPTHIIMFGVLIAVGVILRKSSNKDTIPNSDASHQLTLTK